MKFKKSEVVFFEVIIIRTNIVLWLYICIQIIFSGLNESSVMPWSLSIENATLLENIRKELGVTSCWFK